MSKCIAYREDGRICGLPAFRIDHQRGGMVCAQHADRADWDESDDASCDRSDDQEEMMRAEEEHERSRLTGQAGYGYDSFPEGVGQW